MTHWERNCDFTNNFIKYTFHLSVGRPGSSSRVARRGTEGFGGLRYVPVSVVGDSRRGSLVWPWETEPEWEGASRSCHACPVPSLLNGATPLPLGPKDPLSAEVNGKCCESRADDPRLIQGSTRLLVHGTGLRPTRGSPSIWLGSSGGRKGPHVPGSTVGVPFLF